MTDGIKSPEWVKPMVEEIVDKAFNQGIDLSILTVKLFYASVHSDCPEALIQRLEKLKDKNDENQAQ